MALVHGFLLERETAAHPRVGSRVRRRSFGLCRGVLEELGDGLHGVAFGVHVDVGVDVHGDLKTDDCMVTPFVGFLLRVLSHRVRTTIRSGRPRSARRPRGRAIRDGCGRRRGTRRFGRGCLPPGHARADACGRGWAARPTMGERGSRLAGRAGAGGMVFVTSIMLARPSKGMVVRLLECESGFLSCEDTGFESAYLNLSKQGVTQH